MSLSNLPSELQIAIVRHLGQLLGSNKKVLRRQGRTLALVSSQWRTLGTALSWEKFDLTFDSFEDRVEGEMQHVHEHLDLVKYLTDVSIDLRLLEGSEWEELPDVEPFLKNRLETERFATKSLPLCNGLRHLNMNFTTLGLAQLFLTPYRNTFQNPFPQLESFTFILDDTNPEALSNILKFSVPLPCTALLEVLPLFSSLEKLDLRLRSFSEADLPHHDPPSNPALPNLEHLRIDFAALSDSTEDIDSTSIESEDYLLYVLSLPSPTRLRSLVLSVTFLSSSTITDLHSFASLSALTLRLEPETLSSILKFLPPLLGSLNRLNCLELLATHTISKGKLIEPSLSQLESLLSSLPTSLVSLTTHFDLTTEDRQSVIVDFLNSRSGGSLESWQFYDRRTEEEELKGRTAGYWELVLTEAYKVSEGGERSWKKRARNFRILTALKHRN